MKQIVQKLLISIVFGYILNANEIIIDQTRLAEIKKLNVVLQDSALTIKGVIEKPESYIVKLEAKSPQGSQNITAYLDKSTSELYMGSAYDKNGKMITFPKDAKIINDGVAFSYGSGSKEIYLVTDPQCPYCGRFEKASHGKLEEYTVHVILLPLSFHKKAPVMIEWIMRGKDETEKKARFSALMLKDSTEYQALIKDTKKPFMYSSEVQKYMQKSNHTSRELDVRGTPALYDAKFNPISQDEVLKHTKTKKVK